MRLPRPLHVLVVVLVVLSGCESTGAPGPDPGRERAGRGPDRVAPSPGGAAVRAMLQRAQAHRKRGEFRDGLAAAREAVALAQRDTPDSPELAASLHLQGTLARITGDYADSRAALERAGTIYERIHGPNDDRVAATLVGLGSTYRLLGDYPQAREALARSLAIHERNHPKYHPLVGHSALDLANVLMLQGDHGGAAKLLDRAIAIGEFHGARGRALRLLKFAGRLPAGALAVQYLSTDDALYLYVVAGGGHFEVKRREVSQRALYELIRRYRTHLERGTTARLPWADDGSARYRQQVAPLKAVGRELAEHLLGPIEAELAQHRNLILIPNDLLLYLPLHALERTTPAGPRFLAETHVVSYLTQLELADLLSPVKAGATPPMLALGNPDGSLPAASREVQALGRVRPSVTVLVGEEPSQHLSISDIAGLTLRPGGLAVLSACETALGEQVPGSALITFAAAFSQAGSQSIVASLWKVNDTSTRDLMIVFHRALASVGRAEALRQAQLALLREPATAHPYYWAAFILIGAR